MSTYITDLPAPGLADRRYSKRRSLRDDATAKADLDAAIKAATSTYGSQLKNLSSDQINKLTTTIATSLGISPDEVKPKIDAAINKPAMSGELDKIKNTSPVITGLVGGLIAKALGLSTVKSVAVGAASGAAKHYIDKK